MYKIAIRADASKKIGTGHVMRCLSLLEAFPKETHATFLSHSLLPHLETRIAEKGYHCKSLSSVSSPLTSAYDLLIVDHYDLSEAWEKNARHFARKILVLDDVANRKHEADFLLDQNFNEDLHRYDALVPASCQKFLGPTYALLRDEIVSTRKNLQRDFGKIRSVLISMGGTDPNGETFKVIEALTRFGNTLGEIHVVTTSSNPHLARLEETSKIFPPLKVHVDSPDYVSLVAKTDLAIAAGGSSTWERLCLGLPEIQVSIFDNQNSIHEQLNKARYVFGLGKIATVTIEKIREAVATLQSPTLRKTFSEKGQALVDGLGNQRIFSTLGGT